MQAGWDIMVVVIVTTNFSIQSNVICSLFIMMMMMHVVGSSYSDIRYLCQ